MFEAIIFDMDGLLIDSEPLWRSAEQRVFATVGIELTDDMCRQTTGLRTDEVVKHWFQYMPWRETSLEDIENAVISEVSTLIARQGCALDGVHYILNLFKQRACPIALASSSPMTQIDAVLTKLEIGEYFQAIVSADDLQYGKPHPAVYISTAKQLGIEATKCLAFEDSIPGLIAAKAARMTAVAIPDENIFEQEKFAIADMKLNSLRDFNESHLQRLVSK